MVDSRRLAQPTLERRQVSMSTDIPDLALSVPSRAQCLREVSVAVWHI
jgi:hypothetical protein